MKILYIGEIVGSSGVYCVKNYLSELKKEKEIDFVIANGDGTTGGFGIGKNHSIYLRKLGIDLITTGECVYYKKDMVTHIGKAPYILRAANFPYGNPGYGWKVCTVGEERIAVINLLGQSGFNRVHPSNPFLFVSDLVKKLSSDTPIIIIDFHAPTTAEKNTMFHHMDGKVSAVLGSHCKVLTADTRILPGGTAVITGTGRTGSGYSVGGLEAEIEIRKFLTQVYEQSKISWDNLQLQGVFLEINEKGRAVKIETISLECKGKGNNR